MISTVGFSIESSGEDFVRTLVYPRDADGSPDRITFLAPVGSALLGLSTGDRVAWPHPDGSHADVRIEEIVYQPERAGELHR